MKSSRLIAGILLAVLFVFSWGGTMGSMAINSALSENAVKKAIVKTDAVDQLTDSVLSSSTVNMGGSYGQAMQDIMNSDAMMEFFSVYTANCLQQQVLGNDVEEVANDEFSKAFNAGMDECIADGTIGMTDFERKAFDIAVSAVLPIFTEGINYVLEQMDLMEFVDDKTAAQIETLRFFASDGFKLSCLIIALLSAAAIVVVLWERRIGFVWIGAIMLLIGVLLEVVALILGSSVGGTGEEIALSTQILYVMVTYGLQKMAIISGIVGIILFLARAIINRLIII